MSQCSPNLCLPRESLFNPKKDKYLAWGKFLPPKARFPPMEIFTIQIKATPFPAPFFPRLMTLITLPIQGGTASFRMQVSFSGEARIGFPPYSRANSLSMTRTSSGHFLETTLQGRGGFFFPARTHCYFLRKRRSNACIFNALTHAKRWYRRELRMRF